MSVKRWISTWCWVFLWCALPGCGQEVAGPGMTVTWACLDQVNYVMLEEIRLPSGAAQKRSTVITLSSPKEESFAPDNRLIPAWMELAWLEPVDYKDETTPPPLDDRVAAINRLPLKHQRIEVGSRIPKEVIAQVIESMRNRQEGELPEKGITLLFTWKQGRVYFRWQLTRTVKMPVPGRNYMGYDTTVLMLGGDADYPAPSR